MRAAALAVPFAFSLLALAAPASAKTHPCRDDAERLCKNVEPGQGRVAKCLKEHESELSVACKERREGFREGRGAARAARHAAQSKVHQACKDDLPRLCAGVEQGGGRLAQCLKAHQAEVSGPCKQAMEAAHK